MPINRNSLLHYSLLGQDDALTQDEVRKVVHLYLEEHYDGNQQFVKWPKEIKEVCANLGIVQDRETGFPTDTTGVHVARYERDKFVREENEMLKRENFELRKVESVVRQELGLGPFTPADTILGMMDSPQFKAMMKQSRETRDKIALAVLRGEPVNVA